jgi:ATP-binding cassette, subfamily F, member 3
VLDALLEAIPITPGEARSFLARFLFRGDDVFKEVGQLSGGERSRLELALLGILPSNLLLLDEPTNHLDIPAREAIETFLLESPATLLVVSHDRRLLETVCSTLWVVDDGLAVAFAGGWKEWRAAVADGWTTRDAAEQERRRHATPEARRAGGGAGSAAVAAAGAKAAAGGGVAVAAPSTNGSKPASTKTAATARLPKLSKDAYRRQKSVVDADLTRLGLRKTQLELSLGSPAVTANFVEMRRVTSELADVEGALAAAEEAWLELEERAPSGGRS